MKKAAFVLLLLIIAFSVCKLAPSSDLPRAQVKDLSGKVVELSEYRGKPLIINFWATWCGPCRMEIPMLNELHKKYSKDHLMILGVSTDLEGPQVVKDFMKEVPMVYPVYMMTDGLEEQFGGILALPTTYFFDKQGHRVDQTVGLQSRAFFETRIMKIL